MTYFTPTGGMLLVPGQACDNEVLFRAYYETLLGVAPPFDASPYQVVPGLYVRAPGRITDTNSDDNDLGMASLRLRCARDLCAYGKKHWWYFDCTGVAKFSLSLWRQPAQQYPILCRGGFPTGAFRALNFGIANLISSFNGPLATSQTLTQWLANECVEPYAGWFVRQCIKVFNYRIKKRFGSFAEVFQIYFPAGHPIIEQAIKEKV